MNAYLVQLFVSDENFEEFVVYEGKVFENAHNHWPELLDLDNCKRKHKPDLLIDYTSYFYRNNFYKNKGSNSQKVRLKIKNTLYNVLRLNQFGVFL